MKKALLAGALVAAMFAPMAAQAQDRHDDRGDRGDHHEQARDRGDMRHDRGDVRGDRRDFRGDRGDFGHDQREFGRDRRDDRQAYRGGYGGYHSRGNWNAPFRYRSFAVGGVVPGSYWGSRYYVNDWQRFRLPRPHYGFYRYVRHYDDILLINTRNGRVVQVYRGFYR